MIHNVTPVTILQRKTCHTKKNDMSHHAHLSHHHLF